MKQNFLLAMAAGCVLSLAAGPQTPSPGTGPKPLGLRGPRGTCQQACGQGGCGHIAEFPDRSEN